MYIHCYNKFILRTLGTRYNSLLTGQSMEIERIEIWHKKAITVLISLCDLIVIAGLCACVALIGVKFAEVSKSLGLGLTIAMFVLLSICIIVFCILFINQIVKLRRKVIFVADESGIYDYSRHIVLAPIAYGEIESIEYKEFLSDDASDLRHLRINLKDNKEYMKKLNILQKISFLLGLMHLELHLFSADVKITAIADKLKHNLEIYNDMHNDFEKAV